MQFNEEHIKYLWERYLSKTATSREVRELFELLSVSELGDLHQQISMFLVEQQAPTLSDDPEIRAEILQQINDKRRELKVILPAVSSRPVHRVHFIRKWGWAAAIIVLIGAGVYFYTNSKKSTSEIASNSTTPTDILPGYDKAVLTIGDSQPINLSSNKKGIAVGAAIMYSDGERIADAGQTLQLVTPRGGQYQAVLPDGTKVWLNAASFIQFPSKFTGKERKVKVMGEVYMEIAQNKEKPFIVDVDGKSVVEVLGTSFNVSAYPDENSIKTTLIEGRVKVIKGAAVAADPGRSGRYDENGEDGSSVILNPGQQALIETGVKNIVANSNIDIQQEIAWKDGLFVFNDDNIQSIMRQLSRWYDMEIVYENLPIESFTGEISRSVPVSKVIRLLELTKRVHFTIEGKKIIVTK